MCLFRTIIIELNEISKQPSRKKVIDFDKLSEILCM